MLQSRVFTDLQKNRQKQEQNVNIQDDRKDHGWHLLILLKYHQSVFSHTLIWTGLPVWKRGKGSSPLRGSMDRLISCFRHTTYKHIFNISEQE